MEQLLKQYVEKFNLDDNEYHKQDIPNDKAEQWIKENVPLISIPDKSLEEIYYFRWWIFRKHLKTTEDGPLVTEFLPPVCWAGKHNAIIAAVGHHIAEGKWLKDAKPLLENYIKFWLEEKSDPYSYSTWLADSVYRYCVHQNDFSFGIENLSLLVNFYQKTEEQHLTQSGLFWSIDDNDAMEFSISGTDENGKITKGIRPTLNAYMAANAYAISMLAKKAGETELAEKYLQKHQDIKEKMNQILWDGEFYKAIHTEDLDHPSLEQVKPTQNVKELIGYIPWCFGLAPNGWETAFLELKNEDGFLSPYGLTTAERRHPRYLYSVAHPCLWNGYIWPFATAQVLDAMTVLLQNYDQTTVTKEDFYQVLSQYANMHFLTENGKTVCWIDEAQSPVDGSWSCRDWLRDAGWLDSCGGMERGKDYNHSTFCNIVLSGLLGISSENGIWKVCPNIPDSWEQFAVENLWLDGECYRITYNKHAETPITIEKTR